MSELGNAARVMDNQVIAAALDEIAELLELQDESFFRIRAYREAARMIRGLPVMLWGMTGGQIGELPGIGKDLAAAIAALLETGAIPLRDELVRKTPAGLLELRHLWGLGPKRIRLLADRLNIRGRDDLKRAAESGALRSVPGFGPRIEEHILRAIARRERVESETEIERPMNATVADAAASQLPRKTEST